MDLGKRILARRKSLGMTQQQLASLIKTSHSTISRIENNVLVPTSDVLLALSNMLQVSPNYLLGYSELKPLVSIKDIQVFKNKIDELETKNYALKNILTEMSLRWDLLMSHIDDVRKLHDSNFREIEEIEEDEWFDNDDRMCEEGKKLNREEIHGTLEG